MVVLLRRTQPYILAVALGGLFTFWYHSNLGLAPSVCEPLSSVLEPVSTRVLNGPPTTKFRDNLRPELKYVTTWHGDGISNDVMSYIQLLYLAKTTERVAIMDSFFPNAQHVGRGHKVPPKNLLFSEAFDVPRFMEATGIAVVDWADVKNATEDDEFDTLGCWNLEQLDGSDYPRLGQTPGQLRIDLSHTIVPEWVKIDANRRFIRLSALEMLGFPEMYEVAMRTQRPAKSWHLGVELPPDQQLMCFDWLFFAGEHRAADMYYDYSASWRHAGQHLHFHPKIERLAREYTRQAMGLSADQTIPPFISVHIRHNDFEMWCNGFPREECFAPVSQFALRVKQLQARLLAEKGVSATRVIVTSDEDSEEFWTEVASYGFVRPDHTNTKDEHGPFYPFLIDGAIQAMSHGIVGTDRSTVSGIAARRIQSWQDGLAYYVKWGSPHADEEGDVIRHALEQ
ncbi:hypothetical protein HMN09_01278300 [Mycena chlorophos]|uniref:O-fucosyltransferase family protein n=1 Tax=Mycena chlorophos TaxID=658473 RepID=A0A8H6VWQ2_MYCCL|nr:hypothetical protein HMN09_01278300 [Mycena chlorophos]